MKIEVGGDATRKAIEAAIAKAHALATELGTTYRVEMRMARAPTDHLVWFDGGTPTQPARPILQITDANRAEVAAVMAQRIASDMQTTGRMNKLVTLTLGAQKLRELWVQRIPDGNDVSLKALSPAYLAQKRRRGLRTGIGEATGAMRAAMAGAQIIISRTT